MSKLTVSIPDDLHQKICEELEKQGITTSQFIEQAVTNFFENPKGDNNMATRTLAFQVSEELFQRIKAYLARYEEVHHRKLSQKEFVIGLIEAELDEADEEFAAAEAAAATENTEVEQAAEEPETDDPVDEDTPATDEDAPDESEVEQTEDDSEQDEAYEEEAAEDTEETDQPEEAEDTEPDSEETEESADATDQQEVDAEQQKGFLSDVNAVGGGLLRRLDRTLAAQNREAPAAEYDVAVPAKKQARQQERG